MGKRIAFVGAGAIGGYIGANLTALGHDVTLIDPWPAHVETMRAVADPRRVALEERVAEQAVEAAPDEPVQLSATSH